LGLVVCQQIRHKFRQARAKSIIKENEETMEGNGRVDQAWLRKETSLYGRILQFKK